MINFHDKKAKAKRFFAAFVIVLLAVAMVLPMALQFIH